MDGLAHRRQQTTTTTTTIKKIRVGRKKEEEEDCHEMVSVLFLFCFVLFHFLPIIHAVIYQVHVQLVTCCSNVVEYWMFHYCHHWWLNYSLKQQRSQDLMLPQMSILNSMDHVDLVAAPPVAWWAHQLLQRPNWAPFPFRWIKHESNQGHCLQ